MICQSANRFLENSGIYGREKLVVFISWWCSSPSVKERKIREKKHIEYQEKWSNIRIRLGRHVVRWIDKAKSSGKKFDDSAVC